jgi:PAS domain S-box-containing protein
MQGESALPLLLFLPVLLSAFGFSRLIYGLALGVLAAGAVGAQALAHPLTVAPLLHLVALSGGAALLAEAVHQGLRVQYVLGLHSLTGYHRAICDSLGDIVAMHALDGSCLDANKAVTAVLGYSHDEFLRLTMRDLRPSEHDAIIAAEVEQIHRTGEAVFEFTARHRDGHSVPLETRARRFEYFGQPAILSVARDVTHRKGMEEALRRANEDLERGIAERTAALQRQVSERERAEADLRTIFDASPISFLVVDSEGRLRTHNRVAQENMRTLSGQELVMGEPLERFLPPALGASLNTNLAQALQGEHVSVERQLPGTDNWYAAHYAPVRDSLNEVIGALIIIEGITERKRVEDERRYIQEHWQQSQRMESLGVLAGGIAHDFNNLLQAVLGNTELALMDLTADTPLRHSLTEIRRAAQRAADLSGQMLAYSGHGRLALRPCDLNQTLRAAGEALRATLPPLAELRYELAAELPLLSADGTQLRQVVSNLVINAAEALRKGQGVITLCTRVVESTAAQPLHSNCSELRYSVAAKHLARELRAEYCSQTHCAPRCSALLTHIQPVLATRDCKSEQLPCTAIWTKSSPMAAISLSKSATPGAAWMKRP